MVKLWASVFGIGYIKGGGTIAAAVTAIFWWYGFNQLANVSTATILLLQIGVTVICFLSGIYVGNKVEAGWGKDSSKVVLDEVLGQCVSMLFIPTGIWQIAIISLILFRFFDILKPLGIRRLEKFKGGFGVMIDDVAAGICANIMLQLMIVLFPGMKGTFTQIGII